MSATGYQAEVNETIIITASSPVVVVNKSAISVAAGKLWRMTCLLLCSFMTSCSLD